MPDKERLLNWVEIKRQALASNVARFKAHIGPEVRLAAVVKANAYGHGLLPVAQIVLEAGADWLAVNSIEEASQLRQAGIQSPVLILGHVPLACLEDVVELDLRPTVYNRQSVERLGQIAQRLERPAALHVKVETGTNRQGVAKHDMVDFVRFVQGFPYLSVEGMSTHYANIEDVTEHHFAEYQLRNFGEATRSLEEAGLHVPIKHTACTAAAILFPKTFFNMARVGIGLYGLWPSKETKISALQAGIDLNSLDPVLSWKTRIAQVKTVKSGEAIGYGCTDVATQDIRLAVLPVGYYDGYDRKLSSTGYVLIHGRRAPVLGRVCMNMIMVDVTNIPQARLEDEVILLGRQGDSVISAETMAGKVGTINYEIVTRINPLLPRLVV
ncbi:MAG: alanine racemase [Thermoflexales bacterium]|nr:alanine racemase [Thermoflexales bacterium]